MKHSGNARTGLTGYCRTLVSALVLWVTALPTCAAATDGTHSPPSSASTAASSRLFALTETANWIGASYYITTQPYYDIEVAAVDAGRAWRLGRLLELQGRLGAFHSQGERLDAPWLTDQNSTTSGVTFGGAARVYVFQRRQARLFVEGAVEILYTPGSEQFPPGGTGVNAFLRAGGGLQWQITRRLAVEAHYEYAHVSNGAGSVDQNPMWNGRGGGLTLRHSL